MRVCFCLLSSGNKRFDADAMRKHLIIYLLVVILSCLTPAQDVPSIPVPHANNAVAQVSINGKTHIFSFAGLTKGKTWKDTSKQAFMFVEGEPAWRRLPDLPVKEGRLAASAQGVRGKVYIFGGYTVAKDGSEKSTAEVFRFDPKKKKYKRMKDMPTPVDDMVTFT